MIGKRPGAGENFPRVIDAEKERGETVAKIFRERRVAPRPLEVYEQEKTPEFLEMSKEVTRRLYEWMDVKWGVEVREIPPSSVHIVRPSQLPIEYKERTEKRKTGASYNPRSGKIVLRAETPRDQTTLMTQSFFVHESLHAMGFLSLDTRKNGLLAMQVNNNETDTETEFFIRRSGLGVFSDPADAGQEGARLFHALDEALTEELTKLFDRAGGFRGIKGLEKDLQMRARARADAKSDEIAHIDLQVKGKTDDGQTIIEVTERKFSYQKERALLRGIIADMQTADPKQFPTDQKALQPFVNAAFNGQLLPLARTIEKIYGKGAFRRLAEWDVEKDGEKFK